MLKKARENDLRFRFLISHTAAERVAAERAAVKKEAIVWELSEREMRIVEKLSGQ